MSCRVFLCVLLFVRVSMCLCRLLMMWFAMLYGVFFLMCCCSVRVFCSKCVCALCVVYCALMFMRFWLLSLFVCLFV